MSTNAANDEQKVTLPTEEEQARLDEQREVIEDMIGDETTRAEYETPAGKLSLLEAIVEQGAIASEDTYGLQSMGIVLGDVFAEALGFEWVTVEDSYGRDPALRFPGTTILLFPLTMISKRVERGEQVDVRELFTEIAKELEKVRAQY